LSRDVEIFEVSLRDGLQNETVIVPTQAKLEHLHRLIAAGVRDIEVTSFVRPSRIPPLADAADLAAALPADSTTRFWALVPNQIGMDRALMAGMKNVCTFMSSSETHNRKNVNRTLKESLAALRRVISTSVDEGISVRAYISTVFGCPYEGDVPVSKTIHIAQEMLAAGAGTIVLGDTTGVATPEQVRHVVRELLNAGVEVDQLALHAHDTRGTALVNVYAAWLEGIRKFDGSVAGIGGCPYAPGAAGNAATEDLVHMFEEMGCDTGIALDTLVDAGWAMEKLLGRSLPGRVHRALAHQASSTRRSA
jgi:hydroxymethylglutaryl-CoA lyase